MHHMTFQSQQTKYIMVVLQDYDRAEKFLLPSDIHNHHNIECTPLCICDDTGIEKPITLPVK